MKKTVFSILLLLTFVVAKGQDIPQTKPVVKSVIYVPQALPPSSPTIGEKYLSTNGSYYRWDGSSWILDVVGGTNDASDLTTGVLNDGRVQQSNVTQHQSALVLTESQISDLSHTVDTKLTNSEVEAAYNAQVPVVTQGIAETGTSTVIYRWTPQMINYAIQANAPAQSLSNVLVEGADAGGTTISNVGPPISADDAATKSYIDEKTVDMDGIDKTADFILSDADIAAQILNIQTNDSIVVTVNSGLTNTGFVKMIVEGTGFVAVEQGTITTLNGDYKSQSGEGETLGLRIKDGTEAVVLDPSQLLAYAPVAGGLFDGQNAADPTTEINGIANTSSSDGEITWTSQATNVQNGSYALRAEKTGGTDNDTSSGQITLVGVTNGQNITVSVYLDEDSTQGTNWSFLLEPFRGWDVSQSVTLTGVGYNQFSLTATATQDDPLMTIRTTSAGDLNDILDVDNIVLTVN